MNDFPKNAIAFFIGLIIGGVIIYILNLGSLNDKWIGIVGSLGGVLLGGLLGGLFSYSIKKSEFINQENRDDRERLLRKLEELIEANYSFKLSASALLMLVIKFGNLRAAGQLPQDSLDIIYRQYDDLQTKLAKFESLQNIYLRESDKKMESLGNILQELASVSANNFINFNLDSVQDVSNRTQVMCDEIRDICIQKIDNISHQFPEKKSSKP